MFYYERLEELSRNWKGKVCLFGAGLIGKTRGYDIVKCAGFHVDFYCDNKLAPGTLINNIEVISPVKLYGYKEDVLVFLTVSIKSQKVIEEQIRKNGIKHIIILDDSFQQKIIKEILEGGNKAVKKRWEIVVNDKAYLTRQFKYYMGYEPDLNNPITFNEKLQWLKLYDRDSAYTNMVDKYEVKKYISTRLGEEYVIPTLGVYNAFDEIDFNRLPEQFVLKCTHDSGSIVICRNKEYFDQNNARHILESGLSRNFFWLGREWPYKDVKPRIIAEAFIKGTDAYDWIEDYKIFCFDGIPRIIMTVRGGHDEEEKIIRRMYTPSWELLDVGLHGKKAVSYKEDKPEQLNIMLEAAQKLSTNIRHLRVDFYINDKQILVGELTFYHQCGYEKFEPESYDKLFGSWLSLE